MNSLKLSSTKHISLGHDMEVTLDIRLFFVKAIVLMRFFPHLNMINVLWLPFLGFMKI